MNKILNIISFSTLILTAVFIFYIFFNFLYPFKVIDFKNSQSLPINKSIVRVGEAISYTYDYCKYMDIQSVVMKELVGTETIILLSTSSGTIRIPKGCGKLNIANIIPVDTPAGIYTIYINIDYKINPLRTISYTLKTQNFKVIY